MVDVKIAWSVKDLVIEALKLVGADGLYSALPEECGCGIDDLAPCSDCNLDWCEPAKFDPEDGLYHPIRERVSLAAVSEKKAVAARIEHMEKSIDGYANAVRGANDIIDAKSKRIVKLENALIEERAGSIQSPCRYDGPLTRCYYSGSNIGWCKDCIQKERIRKLARDQLRKEGSL